MNSAGPVTYVADVDGKDVGKVLGIMAASVCYGHMPSIATKLGNYLDWIAGHGLATPGLAEKVCAHGTVCTTFKCDK